MQWNEEKYDNGLQLLKLLDEVDMIITYASWFFCKEEEEWKYVIATPLLDITGPLWLVEKLVYLYKNKKFPEGITPLDIVILKPDDFYAQSNKLTQQEIDKIIFKRKILKKQKIIYRLSIEDDNKFNVYSIDNTDKKPFLIHKNQISEQTFEKQVNHLTIAK